LELKSIKMSSSDDTKTVHLVSQEGETFDVPLSVAKMSELVRSMVEGSTLCLECLLFGKHIDLLFITINLFCREPG
jgi:hypothetical protein